MANKALKGLTIKIGADTSDLTKSLDNIEKQGRSLSGELGQINKLLKFDPKNTELLAQKQKVLSEAISNTEDKLDTLREAEKQVQEQFERGEVSEAQYRALQREIIDTENKLDRYRTAVEETATAQRELADSSEEATRELDDQADKTRDAEDATDDMDDASNDLAMGGLAAMAAAATAAVSAIVALAEETREYRNEMAKLDTAFQDNGFSAETATKTYEALQSVVGETEQAVEAANHLASLAETEEDLTKWTDILTGVYGKFGASLQPEALAEAANETKRTGQVTGAFADALNWAALEGETFGVTMKDSKKDSKSLSKAVSDTEAKLSKLKETQEKTKDQLETSKEAVSKIKAQIKATKEELAGYKKTIDDAGGSCEEWDNAISSAEKKLEKLKEAEKKAQAQLDESKTATKEAVSSLKDEISATNKTLKNYQKAAKDASAPTEEWNKKVEEAATAEDYFNLALEECSDEQERQQLITETLTKIYGNSAAQFKKTNREVIRANQATEKWNKATAKIGKTVEPVMTDIKELGVVLLEDASEPLENIAEYIRKDVLPAIKKVSSWVRQNGPLIKSTLIGVTTALVAYKVATIATEVAHKGLKGAILATAAAEKALQLVQAATPWGLAAVAVAGVVTALVAYSESTKEAIGPVYELTEEEKELTTRANEAAEAFRDQKEATDEALGDVTAEMQHTQDLADELIGLADASGKVKEKDKERADFLIHELNDALGTEYSMTGLVIDNYKDLKKSIDDVIESKTANALLEAANEKYVEALNAEEDAFGATQIKGDAYYKQKDHYQQKEREYADEIEKLEKQKSEAVKNGSQFSTVSLDARIAELKGKIADEKKVLDDSKKAWDESTDFYKEVKETILNYQKAQASALSGNYKTTVDLLTKKGTAYKDFSEEVDEETAKVLATLEKEAIDAGIEAENTKKNFENGVDGYTKDMVKEAEESYKKALGKFGSAYSDAYGLGENFGQGLADGIKIKNGAVGAAAIAQIREAVKAAKKEAEINSPSKKTMEIGAGLGEGNEVGIEKKTKDVKKAASDQISAVLDTYRAQEVNAQKTIRNLAEKQSASQINSQMSVASANSGMLEKILTAIEKGQVLTIDGDTLVGATANRMDNALGRRRDLAARGAI